MTKKYQLNYADGYYIEKDGEGFLDFDEGVSGEEAQSLVDTLNKESETIHKLREALRQINNSNNWWFKDGTYVWANKEDLHEWIEKRIEESK